MAGKLVRSGTGTAKWKRFFHMLNPATDTETQSGAVTYTRRETAIATATETERTHKDDN